MKGIIINHDTSYISYLEKLFNDCDVINYKNFDEVVVDNYDFIILSGGEINISGKNDIVREKEYLRQTNKPVLGICLGHQIIGILNGSNLRYDKLKEFDEIDKGFKITPILNTKLNLYYYHKCYIDNISNDFTTILDDHNGVKFINLMESKSRRIMGIQFHPEKSEKDGIFIKNYFYKNYL